MSFRHVSIFWVTVGLVSHSANLGGHFPRFWTSVQNRRLRKKYVGRPTVLMWTYFHAPLPSSHSNLFFTSPHDVFALDFLLFFSISNGPDTTITRCSFGIKTFFLRNILYGHKAQQKFKSGCPPISWPFELLLHFFPLRLSFRFFSVRQTALVAQLRFAVLVFLFLWNIKHGHKGQENREKHRKAQKRIPAHFLTIRTSPPFLPTTFMPSFFFFQTHGPDRTIAPSSCGNEMCFVFAEH